MFLSDLSIRRPVFATVLVLALTSTTYAQEAGPNGAESGFSAQLSLGTVFANAKNNLVPSTIFGSRVAEKSLDSLYRKPDGNTVVLPAIRLSLRYTFAESQTQLFVANGDFGIEDQLQLNGSIHAGIRQGLGHVGKVELGYLFGIPSDVWADPYVTGVERKETTRSSHGARLAWEEICGSPLQLQYIFRHNSIDSEQSGTFLGLSPSDAARLRRAGNLHQAEIRYPFMLGRTHRLVPAFSYSRDDLEGEAMSANNYDLNLSYTHFARPFVVVVDGSIGVSLHDKRNPVFQKLQEDTRHRVAVSVVYQNPFGLTPLGIERWGLFVTTGHAAADSNIDFYSRSIFHAGAGLSFSL